MQADLRQLRGGEPAKAGRDSSGEPLCPAGTEAVKNAQGQLRVFKDALESRINNRVQGDHQAVPWIVTLAATVINKGRKEDEGFTAHWRWKVREFARPVVESGESVICLPAASVGRNKFDVRWEDGVWPGIKIVSGESIIAKARDLRRTPQGGGRWSNDGVDGFNGLP